MRGLFVVESYMWTYRSAVAVRAKEGDVDPTDHVDQHIASKRCSLEDATNDMPTPRGKMRSLLVSISLVTARTTSATT